MPRFSEGDRVRVDIPDTSDPDHERFHGEHGEIVAILEDEAGKTTGESRDNDVVRVELDSDDTIDFRRRDLRPPIE